MPDHDLNPLVRSLLATVPPDVDDAGRRERPRDADISRDEVVDLTIWGVAWRVSGAVMSLDADLASPHGKV
jgi:hypothetical protein